MRIIDQRALPARLRFLNCRSVDALCDAISSLAVRGAPALGAAGAYGVALAAHTLSTKRQRARRRRAHRAHASDRGQSLRGSATRALAAYEDGGAAGALACAERIAADDVACNRALSAHGAVLVPYDGTVLTHCNAGALACVGYGTALGIVRSASEQQRHPRVVVDETRPLLQGARLTMWELDRLGIDATLSPDSAAASLMARGEVDVVIVGADRVAANGDVANKIGTYAIALAARHHGVPFYVAAPTATIDLATASGEDIVIEERDAAEVTHLGGIAVAPPGVAARNPAFDVTPARLVTAMVTEVGIARPPYRRSLPSHSRRALVAEGGVAPRR